MTKRLYESDSYCREFEARVEACELKDGLYNTVLDQTAFFPEGGGQQADGGTLNGIEVVDVQLESGVIVHKTKEPLTVGSVAVGKLDWELRFARMQSHSAEHIVSGVTHSMFGYSNVGFHMSEITMTADFDGVLTKQDVERIELKANRAIYDNIPITVSYPEAKQIAEINYRSKKEIIDGLRLVTIGDVDCCACCAPHLSRTGEIGLVKIINFYPNKGGTRVEMIAGLNAFKDYSALNDDNKKLMSILSVSRNGVVGAAERQCELISDLRRENRKISVELAAYKLTPVMINGSGYAFSANLSYDDLRFCSNSLIEKGLKLCVLFSKNGENEYIYAVNSSGDVKDFVKSLNNSLNGKGGGRSNYAQGKVIADYADIKAAVEELLKREA